MPSALDDRTAAYVVAVHPAFEDMRQVTAQIAGLLVLEAAGSRDAAPDHPLLGAAEHMLAQAADGLDRARGLAQDATRDHHRHLDEARASLRVALATARRWPLDVEAVMGPLRDGYAHLQTASALLPGFHLVSFEQACCAVRRPPAHTD